MKYYTIKETMDEKIVGNDHPQVYKFIKGYNPEAPNALFSLYKFYDTFPDYVPNLDGLKLSGSSKLTDIVSNGFSGRFFIISARTKELLDNYNLCPHRFYSVGLYKRNIKHDYYLYFIQSNYSDFVDYQKTCFVIHSRAWNKETEPIEIKDKKDFFEKRDRVEKERGIMWGIKGNRIVMSDSFDTNIDFLEICILDTNTYISERLKLAIESLGITGWEFTLADHLII